MSEAATTAGGIVGVWKGRGTPCQETRLGFFEDGHGLLFYFWGSHYDPPFVDEFVWKPLGEDRLEVTWQTRHMCDHPEDCYVYEYAPVGPAVFTVTSNVTEEVGYKLDGQGLEITIGMQDSEFTKLRRVGPAGDYDTEYSRLTRLAANLDPRQWAPEPEVWTMDEPGVFHKVALRTKASGVMYERLLTFTNLIVILFGVMGQAYYLADYVRHLMPENLVVVLHMIPVLQWVFADDGKSSGLTDRLAPWIRSLAAGWYLAITTLVLVMLAKGYRPDGFVMYLAFIAPGTWYSLRVFRQRRR